MLQTHTGKHCIKICAFGIGGSVAWLLLAAALQAAEVDSSSAAVYSGPRWALELKGGNFKPDLDDYKQFYGSDDTGYWGLAGAYRFNRWLELGAEAGYTRDSGQGVLPDDEVQGGNVKLTLIPVQLYLNARYDVEPDQLFVPYVGAGIAAAWYEQRIALQETRTGHSDVGFAGRAGIQLLLNRLDPGRSYYVTDDRPLKGYAFLEYQNYSTKKKGAELGGESVLFGLRFEF